MLNKLNNIKYVLLILLTFTAVSCGDDYVAQAPPASKNTAQTAMKKAAEEAKKKAEEEKKRLAEEEAEKERNKKYNISRYNPFKTYIIISERSLDTSKKIMKTPLECCDISIFKVKMVVISGKDSVAWITGEGGKKYSVKKGTKIGLNDGKIIKIHDKGITIREYISAGEKGKISVEKELLLPAVKK